MNKEAKIKKEKITTENSEKISPEKELEAEINRLREEKLRLLADSDNQRKSYQQTTEYIKNYSNKRIILWILDFLADLEKVLEFMRQETEPKIKDHLPVLETMKNNCEKNLEKEGVREIKIELEKDQLDRYSHQVVAEVENNNLPEETILAVVKKGYLLHEQVLKASQVKISKKPSAVDKSK